MAQISRTNDAEIENGNIIDADDLDAELDSLVAESNSQDTRITDIESGAFTFTSAKTFSSNILVNGIDERTAASGVTIDGVLLKDNGVTASGTNAFSGASTFSHSSGVTTNTLTERTAAAGVTADSVLLKDGNLTVGAAGYAPTTEGQFGYDTTGNKFYGVEDTTKKLVFPEFIILRDEKAQNTAGGTFTSGAWQTRTLNTESTDTGGNCSLASNQFTLDAGTYVIDAQAPASEVGPHQTRLQNITDGTTTITGTTALANSAASYSHAPSTLQGVFTIASSKAFELQHRCTSTKATSGFGLAANLTTEVYATVKLMKIR